MRCVCGHAREPHRHDRPSSDCSLPVPTVPTPLALDSIGVAAPGPEIIPGADIPMSAVHDRFESHGAQSVPRWFCVRGLLVARSGVRRERALGRG